MLGKILAALLLISSPALAEDRIAVKQTNGQECTMKETAQVGININNAEIELTQVKTIFDKKIEDIRKLAAEAGVTIDLQSYNYNVYNNNNGDCSASQPGRYQYNGNVSFTVTPLEKSGDFAALLSKNGYSANMNVNAYTQCQ